MVSRRILLLVGAAAVLGLPPAARLWRGSAEGRCSLDGLEIDPRYAVRLVETGGGQRRFCSPACLTAWLRHEPRFAELYVTDELSGREIDARRAWLVRSTVVTHRATGNRIHCFRQETDARRHAEEARGKVLTPAEHPWQIAAAEQS